MITAAAAAANVYDLIVIGAGSGGLECAYNSAVFHKAKVAVVEPQLEHGPPHYSALGGTCVNIGCVPKKLLVTGATYRHQFMDSKGFGWQTGAPTEPVLDWSTLMKAKDAAVQDINKSYMGMFEDAKMDLIQGWGTVGADGASVVIHSKSPIQGGTAADPSVTVRTKNVLVAVGGWPNKPTIPGIEHAITSNEAFYIPTKPKSVLVVGGGYIAVEFACIFNGLGVNAVHLMYRGSLFLRGFDQHVREELKSQMSNYPGMNLHFGENPAKIEKQPDGTFKVTTEKGTEITVDLVMYATGRVPRSSGLGLTEAKVNLSPSGAVLVDEYGRTNVPSVWALGDVTDRIQLTPVAIHEGACIADTIFGKARAQDHVNVASAVFSIPPIGTVGVIEEEACKKYPRVAVYQSSFKPLMHNITGASYKKFLVKIVTDHTTGRVLGVHIIGADAAEIIQGVGIAVKMGAKIENFYSTIGVHPTSAEELCSMKTPAYYYVDGVKNETLPSSL